jgi:UDP-N-acetylmuramoylalanine--D-glutamate ligase
LPSITKKTYKVDNLPEAVKIAKEVTKKWTVCLLSPAASSYTFFKNFEERGRMFKELVRG